MSRDYRDKVDTTRCYFCPTRHDIEVHHIVPQRFQGDDKRENLVALCERCHKKLERLYDGAFYEALGIEDPQYTKKAHFFCEMGDCTNVASEKWANKPYEGLWYCDECAPRTAPRFELVAEVDA